MPRIQCELAACKASTLPTVSPPPTVFLSLAFLTFGLFLLLLLSTMCIQKRTVLEWSSSIAGRMLALHVTDPNLIAIILCVPLSLPGWSLRQVEALPIARCVSNANKTEKEKQQYWVYISD